MAQVSANMSGPSLPNMNRWNIGRVWSTWVFRYQHFATGIMKLLSWGSTPTRDPNVSGFPLQWNIGLTCTLITTL